MNENRPGLGLLKRRGKEVKGSPLSQLLGGGEWEDHVIVSSIPSF